MSRLIQATCVALHGRGVLIQGAPGTGKSNLALALIDRGAVLVGDDGVRIEAQGGLLRAFPPPHIAGLLEVRNVGLVPQPVTSFVPLALVLELTTEAHRLPDEPETLMLEGIALPLVRLWPDSPVLALRAEAALDRRGLSFAANDPQIGIGQ